MYLQMCHAKLMGSARQEVACALAALGQCHANLGNDRTHKDEGMWFASVNGLVLIEHLLGDHGKIPSHMGVSG